MHPPTAKKIHLLVLAIPDEQGGCSFAWEKWWDAAQILRATTKILQIPVPVGVVTLPDVHTLGAYFVHPGEPVDLKTISEGMHKINAASHVHSLTPEIYGFQAFDYLRDFDGGSERRSQPPPETEGTPGPA